MDCEAVRDRFSSLWEKELSPPEEKVVGEHLASCPECRREFEKFEKTMRWLHSVDEAEVPEGFLAGLHQKMEEGKGAFPPRKPGGRGFHFPLSFKLPAQAVAMVAVVFLALYLTKMVPIDGYRLKEVREIPSPLSVEQKPEGVSDLSRVQRPASERGAEKPPSGPAPSLRPEPGRGVEKLAQHGVEREGRAFETSAAVPRPKDAQQVKAPALRENRLEEGSVAPLRADARKTEAPAPSPEVLGSQKVDSKEAAKTKAPVEIGLVAKEKSLAASKPPQEIALRISDRSSTISQLHGLVRRFGGNVIAVEGDIVFVSLPTASISELEKELGALSSPGKADFLTAKKDAEGSLRSQREMKREGDRKKNKEPAKSVADAEDRSTVRIRLVQE